MTISYLQLHSDCRKRGVIGWGDFAQKTKTFGGPAGAGEVITFFQTRFRGSQGRGRGRERRGGRRL